MTTYNEDTRFCRLFAVVSSSLIYKKQAIEIIRFKPEGIKLVRNEIYRKPFDLHRNQRSVKPKQNFKFWFGFFFNYFVSVI